jgi:hypothetical protein
MYGTDVDEQVGSGLEEALQRLLFHSGDLLMGF